MYSLKFSVLDSKDGIENKEGFMLFETKEEAERHKSTLTQVLIHTGKIINFEEIEESDTEIDWIIEIPLLKSDEKAREAYEYLKSVGFTPEDYKKEIEETDND